MAKNISDAISSSPTSIQIVSLLIDLEQSLRGLDLWSLETPSDKALKSTQPFCMDAMSLSQWLQFIFIPRLDHMIRQKQPLPTVCGILPMAEETYKQQSPSPKTLLDVLGKLDQVLGGEQ